MEERARLIRTQLLLLGLILAVLGGLGGALALVHKLDLNPWLVSTLIVPVVNGLIVGAFLKPSAPPWLAFVGLSAGGVPMLVFYSLLFDAPWFIVSFVCGFVYLAFAVLGVLLIGTFLELRRRLTELGG